MSREDKIMRSCLGQKTVVFCGEESVQEVILAAERAYYEAEAQETLSGFDFLYQQSKYIRKSWWALQGGLLLLLWILLKYSESACYVQRSIGVIAPLFAILILPELWKNKSTQSMEIETAAYYSLRQVYAARLILFALVDLCFLTIFFAAASYAERRIASELMVQFLVPFNVTCCICFRTLYSKRITSEAFALLLCIIWTAVWGKIVLNNAVYLPVMKPVWAGMLALSVLYLGYVIGKGQKHCLEIWEGITLWN